MSSKKNHPIFERAASKINAYIKKHDLHLRSENNDFSSNNSCVIYLGGFSGFQGVYERFNFRIVVDKSCVRTFMYLPSNISKSKRGEMAEFITRANYGMILGKFEMDYEDGEVRFQYALPLTAIANDTSEESLDAIFFLAPSMMKRYAPGMAKILLGSGNTKPEQLIRECECENRV